MKKFYLFSLAFLLILNNSKAQLTVFGDAYGTGISFNDFGGATNTLSVDNSVKFSGTSSLKVVVPSAGYTGGAMKQDVPVNVTAYNAVTFYAKASLAKTLNVSGLGNNGSSSVYQAEYQNVALTTNWVKYIIPIPDPSKLTAIDGLFHFAEGSDEGAYTIWFDDIKYENLVGVIGTPAPSFATETITKTVGELFTPNGTTAVFPLISGSVTIICAPVYFNFTSSNTSVASIDAMSQGTAKAPGSADITGTLKAVASAGKLTVNVVAAGEPTVAAPIPTRLAADVINLFSNVYNEVPVDTWSAVWDQADLEDIKIAGDSTKKYTKLLYAGIEFTSQPIDASAMGFLHMDIWTPNSSLFKIKLVDFGNDGVYSGGDDTESELTYTPGLSQWVSYDIPLSSFVGLGSTKHLAQMILSGSTSTVYVDNVFFYKASTATEPTVAAPAPTRAAAAVINLFSDVYQDVPVDTWSAVWDQADLEDVKVAGDSTKKYTNLLYAGIEFTTHLIDASAMDYLHLDIWTPNSSLFKVKLVDFGNDGSYAGGDDTESELTYNPGLSTWVSYDIPLSSFTGLAARKHLAQMILSGSTSTVYVDNVYFYNSVLPVQITKFTVTKKENQALLNWATATESGNKGFYIERSNDNINWSQIGFVAGAGYSSALKEYNFADATPLSGKNYYRLRQTDNDGHFSLSNVQFLNFIKTVVNNILVYPNPAENYITVSFSEMPSAAARYSLVNASGVTVKAGILKDEISNNKTSINVSSLPSGRYIFYFNDAEFTKSINIIIQH